MKSRIVIVLQNAEIHTVLSDDEAVHVEVIDLAYDFDGEARAAAAEDALHVNY